ncbi:MAG TPA: FAD-binding oxidoreductase [Solirubrobacteraceae bacterium]|nr:FAD-binding oxidoreductase [Solirubrobacteraceae bacterium]
MSQSDAVALRAEEIRTRISGEVITPDDAGYEEARRVWNGMVDRRPAAVVRCSSSADVVSALAFARANGLVVAVRCGAHSTPGYSSCDDGIVIDLRGVNRVEVDPEARTARVGGGTLWGELDAATQEHGLAVTGGRVSDTGVGGLALGSGSGWLERTYGVTCESLISAEVVTADGSIVRASAEENPELFWALRGGGGNFGVVTEFEFALHPVGPILTAGMLAYPRSEAAAVIRNYRDFIEAAPEQIGGGVALISAPPEPFVPEEVRGKPAVGVIYCYVGDVEEGQAAAAPLREFGSPALDMIQPMPYTALQQMLDAGNPHGIREYFKVDWLRALSDETIDLVVEHAERLPAPFGQLILAPMGGAVGRLSGDDVALSILDAPWMYFCLSMWMDPAEDDQNTAWARGFAEAMRAFGIGRTYPNFIEPDEGVARLKESFGPDKYERLVAVKREWDPDNVFCLNQNISPNGG